MLWYVNCHNTSPTHADLARGTASAPTAHCYFIHGTNSGNRCQDSVFPSSPWRPPLSLPAAPPPTRGCSSTLRRQISPMLVLSLFVSSLLLLSVSHSLAHYSPPCLFPINTLSPICSSVSKTGMTETSRPVPGIRRNAKVLKKQKAVWGPGDV